ncbi:MAG: shikimate kinase [Alphaproteobacteria bacterium]
MNDSTAAIADKTIVLVGLMGAGKTSVGRRLAVRLTRGFVDADSEIESAAGMSVGDIFATHGEAHFRDGERRVIARLLDDRGQVLATGGGAFMDPETRALIKRDAVSVWLKAELDVLFCRVSRRTTRPLLNQDNPKGVLEGLMRERYPVYAGADITVTSDDIPHEAMVERIVAALAGHPS